MPKRQPNHGAATRASAHRRPGPASEPADDFLVVAVGASAGGLAASRRFLAALPVDPGMAFILVQHLDPTHESMMASLLADHTSMTVLQATDGMPIAYDHVYVIPPDSYLSVDDGALRLSPPQVRRGARLPFDFLLHSMAEKYGARAVCVVLSGSGADGSLGLKAVKAGAGLVVAQDPAEAEFDGMPGNAVLTGAVDLVLPVAEIPEAIVEFARRRSITGPNAAAMPRNRMERDLAAVVDLLRDRTAHDFRLYKQGTLQRRIERRMALSKIDATDMGSYLDLLRGDERELRLLADDLLINVTSFFRDPKVFEFLEKNLIPELVRSHSPGLPLRVWVVGCSTGQESYSLAMLFHEAIAAAKRNIKLQIFASDVDPDAVSSARDGIYPEAIESEVSPERLARYFSKEDKGYRISPELRSDIVFTVHDVLVDPPFSRIDLVSCRNLLIYLRPDAQATALSLFHFALHDGGLLLLGSSETAGESENRFEAVSKPTRLYRRTGQTRPGEVAFTMRPGVGTRVVARPGPFVPTSPRANLVELSRRMLMEAYAPAAVLINANHECLYFLGATDRYLKVATGHPTHDLLVLVRQDLRDKLRSAVRQARQDRQRVHTPGGRRDGDDGKHWFRIDVQPVPAPGEELYLVCFVDEPTHDGDHERPKTRDGIAKVAELERELAATKTELLAAVRNLEMANEEQKAINEEALSVNEEFQSTNEELLTSKEEMQSLNEELTALNGQLQESLEQQRRTSNDLLNVLNSTDVATLFLDQDLRIRFFTAATKSLFNVIPGDVGRPLGDLNALAPDDSLLTDAGEVLNSLAAMQREVEAGDGTWFMRRIMPYRTRENHVEGVVITFADITLQKQAADAQRAAKLEAERASVAKSRFLAAASHDLRQPLQTLALLQGRLEELVTDPAIRKLVTMFDQTLGGMSDMLNTLLDLNQIEAGIVQPTMVSHRVDELLSRLRDAFSYEALAHGISLRVVPCSLSIRTDPHLLEQMLRNLLSNAMKYARGRKVLVGCRRRAGRLSIEVWDTGPGIPRSELQAIFNEFHQLDNPARERKRGLGLGLSIVQRLGDMLGHGIAVRSQQGRGSVFAVEVDIVAAAADRRSPVGGAGPDDRPVGRGRVVLIVEDDPDVRSLLDENLSAVGFRTRVAADGATAFALIENAEVQPDLVLVDFNLPGGTDGAQVATKLRRNLRRRIPVVMLTGDVSAGGASRPDLPDCVRISKPVKSKELLRVIGQILAEDADRTA